MKLLFDQNLSPKLVKILGEVFPHSGHVFFLGMDKSEDTVIWEYARENEFVLVTRDAYFGDLSVLRGFPPYVVWIRRGNYRTTDIASILRQKIDVIKFLESDSSVGMIPLF